MFFIPVETSNQAAMNILLSIDAQSFEEPWTQAQWNAEVENPANSVLILSADRELLFPVGFISWGIGGETMELKKIAVLPAYQGKKLAKEALMQMMDVARDKKVHNIMAEVAVTNSRAIGLYESFGFYKVHTRKKYYNKLIDAFILQKEV